MPFRIEDFSITTLEDNKFISPVRLRYTQNGQKREWEAVQAHDSVAVLLYHRDRRSFLIVKQFRAAVHMNHAQVTFTHELCAGIIDKDLPLEEIAREEVFEECGYDIAVDKIHRISSFFTNVGITGNRQHLYFAILEDSQKAHEGGGIHNEEIVLEYIHVSEARTFLYDERYAKTPGLMFAFYWFFEQFGNQGERLPHY